MGFPNKQELERVKKKLKNVDPIKLLPADASIADQLKFNLCKEFVIYIRKNNLTQIELAKQLHIDPARLNEIIKYKIDLFTVDRLLFYVYKIRPNLKLVVG